MVNLELLHRLFSELAGRWDLVPGTRTIRSLVFFWRAVICDADLLSQPAFDAFIQWRDAAVILFLRRSQQYANLLCKACVLCDRQCDLHFNGL